MSLLSEFNTRYEPEPTEQAKKILFEIIGDLVGRRGFGSVWDCTNNDTKEELLRSNLEIVQQNLS